MVDAHTETVRRKVDQKPKEHGAYAILFVPLTASLIISGITIAGACVAISATCGFLANEPLLIAMGHRGDRARRESVGAGYRLIALLSLSVFTGMVAMILLGTDARIALLACLFAAGVGFMQSIRGNHRTHFAQMLGVVGLTLPCVPILLAGDLAVAESFGIWGTFLVGFLATTSAVHGVIAAQKKQNRLGQWFTLISLSLLVMITLAVADTPVIAAFPMLVMSWYLVVFPPPAKHLRRVGWSLVAGTVASAIWLIWMTSFDPQNNILFESH